MPGSSLGAGIWESSSQGRSLCSGPKAWAAPRLAVLLRVGFCLGAVSIDTALPVSRLPLPSLGLMLSEHHVLLQLLNRCSFPCLKCGGEQSILHPVTGKTGPHPSWLRSLRS